MKTAKGKNFFCKKKMAANSMNEFTAIYIFLSKHYKSISYQNN